MPTAALTQQPKEEKEHMRVRGIVKLRLPALNLVAVVGILLAADSLGNFYVATGRIGTSLCGAGGSGALVRVTPDVSRFACRTLGVTLADSKDVALSPNQTLAYMPIRNLNVVARMTRP